MHFSVNSFEYVFADQTSLKMADEISWYLVALNTLQWRGNGRNGVSNRQPHDCLLNRLFRRRTKKTSKLRVTGLCAGIHRWPVKFPHKGPATRKCFYLMTSSWNSYNYNKTGQAKYLVYLLDILSLRLLQPFNNSKVKTIARLFCQSGREPNRLAPTHNTIDQCPSGGLQHTSQTGRGRCTAILNHIPDDEGTVYPTIPLA